VSGFSNPVSNAVGTLIRTVLKSINYVAATTGWAIFKNGNADFATGAFRGTVTVTGPNGAQIVIDAGATYPNLTLFSPDHSNSAGVSITGGASGADMLATSGTFTPADAVVRRGRLWFDGAVDQLLLHVIKQSNQASFGGIVILQSDGAFYGYRDADGGLFYYLQITKTGAAVFSSGVLLHMSSGSTLTVDNGSSLTLGSTAPLVIGGVVQPRGRLDYVTGTVSTGAIGAEAIFLTGNAVTFVDGTAYRIRVGLNVTLAVANGANAQVIRVRVTNLAGTLERTHVQRCVVAGTESVYIEFIAVRTAGSNLTTQLVVTGQGLTNTFIADVTGNSPYWMEIITEGAATDYVNANVLI
jgi:hypothetical protein